MFLRKEARLSGGSPEEGPPLLTDSKAFDIIGRFRELVLLLLCYPRIVIWAGQGSAPRFQWCWTDYWSMGLSEVLAKEGSRQFHLG